MNYPLEPIAVIRTPFKEKFATPRQPGLAPSITARIDFLPDFATLEAIRELDGFSHLWLIFLFHQNWQKGWQPTVRPPRLGGNKRVGVYASRSPFRPNPIGLSAVKLLEINCNSGQISLLVQGADLIDTTPIFDIKPYIPYSDSIPKAIGGFATKSPEAVLPVEFSPLATKQLEQYRPETPDLEVMLCETLSLDPRPAYRQNQENSKEYGMLFDRYDVKWRVDDNRLVVVEILVVNSAT